MEDDMENPRRKLSLEYKEFYGYKGRDGWRDAEWTEESVEFKSVIFLLLGGRMR